jgi:hypothetical protein
MRSSAADIAAVVRRVAGVGLDGVFIGDHLVAAVPLQRASLVLSGRYQAPQRGLGVMVLAPIRVDPRRAIDPRDAGQRPSASTSRQVPPRQLASTE